MGSVSDAIIYIVDDAPEILDFVQKVLVIYGFKTECFSSGEEFLKVQSLSSVGCVLLDNQMPGISGLEVQAKLKQSGQNLSILFMSGASSYADVVDAIRNGAVGFLQKPFLHEQLITQVTDAVAQNLKQLQTENSREEYMARVEKLTAREKEVYELVVLGQTNKSIAKQMSISISTVEFHRRNMLKKLGAASMAELMAIELSFHR